MFVSRRWVLSAAPLAVSPFLPETFRQGQPPDQPASMPAADTFPTQAPGLVREMVAVSHNNPARVRELLTRHPTLARAAWDWGFGDWEDALGAASHVGNREIALMLLDHGARPTIFSAAMLGHLETVKAFVTASPGVEATPGPHGITLLRHAMNGGAVAQPVVEYLRTLPGADRRPATQAILADDLEQLTGDYIYGPGVNERITVGVAATTGLLTFTRAGGSSRNLMHVGARAFFPVGAPLVRIVFEVSSTEVLLTVHDPGPVLQARRARSGSRG